MADAISRAMEALRYPADDPSATAIVALAVAVSGLLVAVILMAFASPGRKASPRRVSGTVPADSVDVAADEDSDL